MSPAEFLAVQFCRGVSADSIAEMTRHGGLVNVLARCEALRVEAAQANAHILRMNQKLAALLARMDEVSA